MDLIIVSTSSVRSEVAKLHPNCFKLKLLKVEVKRPIVTIDLIQLYLLINNRTDKPSDKQVKVLN